MSIQQYIRKASLIVGDSGSKAIDLSSLRFHFVIQRGDLQTPNTAQIRVYNVAAQTTNQLQSPKEFGRVVIQAGYDGNYGIIFEGTVKQVRNGRENTTDTYVDISAADGDSAYNFATVSLTLAAGSTTADHANAAINQAAPFGVSPGYLNIPKSNPLPRGKVIYGDFKTAMRGIAANAQTTWSIQDGKVNMIPITAYMPGDIPVINSKSGMIGLPEQTQNGVRVRLLLNPSIKIGTPIQINETSIQKFQFGLGTKQTATNGLIQVQNHLDRDGFYKVLVAEHTGDTRGNDWYTDIIAIALDAANISLISKNLAVTPLDGVKPYQ